MEILDRLLQSAQQAEVLTTTAETTTVRFQANHIKGSDVEETRGVAVRVVKDGRLGFAATSDVVATGRMIDHALQSAAYGDAVPISFPSPCSGPEVRTYDPTIAEMPVAQLAEIGSQIVELLAAVGPDVLVNIQLRRGVHHSTIRNHAGADITVERSPFSMSIEVNRVRGDDILILFETTGGTVWQEDVLAPARRLARKLELAERIATIRSGEMPVLFSPTGGLVLAVPLLVGLDGRNVYRHISPLAGRLGEPLLDPKLTLVDDPTLDGRFGSATHDDEGVAHRRTPLIKDGTLAGFYYDLKTAAQAGSEPTGNGSRDLFSAPRPAPTNLVMAAGETPIAELVAGIDEGLVVDDVLGLGQGNILSGAFSNPLALAYKIEKGRIVGRVKEVSVAGNVYEVLKDIAAVSRERSWVHNFVQLPYILLPHLNVVAKGPSR